ncbi:MAG: HoxN/HupN/NixA family nickel/cobalt transporter [Alphaproteobacteria bacterium]|nr:HoxN/HupN/NixA family nickel/cobalt transporter [Alphaproteobacteria bacterium]
MKLSLAIFDDCRGAVRVKIIGVYSVLIGANLLAWAWAVVAFYERPVLLGTALIAYGFGLRHAVDADHIAAIDNVTRKLMQEGKHPIAVGFFFALGHSTVVVLGSGVIVLTASTLQSRFPEVIKTGSLLGTLVSVIFLFLIATINIVVLAGIFRLFRRVRRGEKYADEELNLFLGQRGILGRLFRSLFRLISRSWHMYPLGFLFGLGFDTATEIGVLGISAAAATSGLRLWSILVFPALFTAAMSLVDTSDGVLMLGAYGWAFVNPMRKLYYNLAITFISVVAAVAVGSVEVLGLIAGKLGWTGGVWDMIEFGALGYLIVGIFVVSWVVSYAIYRMIGNEGSA